MLGRDLPLIDDTVTVEHLLAHRSGIGDYLDESELTDINDYLMPVPVHQLAKTEDYLTGLDGKPQVFPPGSRFAYNNSGFVVLALLLERITGQRFEDIVEERVCRPAGMVDTAFVRSDQLTGEIAVGYLDRDGLRTNVFLLPVMGSGDGGLIGTASDVQTLWSALFADRIVSADSVRLMMEPRSVAAEQQSRYGLGFWVHRSRPIISLVGYDPGVSFRTVHDPESGVTHTVISNTHTGAWPISRLLDTTLGL